MPRYWIIAPFDATKTETWEKFWHFDLDNGCISIGWGNLGDISDYDRDKLKSTVVHAYPEQVTRTKTRYANMLWDFFHAILTGDIIIARKGTKCIAAVGIVTKPAYFSREKNDKSNDSDDPHFKYLERVLKVMLTKESSPKASIVA